MNPLLLKAAPYAALIAVALIAYCQHDASQRRIGQQDRKLFVAESTLAVVRAEGRQIDSTYSADTATFRAELARWQALKQRIRTVVRDSILPPDTVEGPERVVVRDSVRPPTLDEILRAADATIQRCSTALGTCELRIGNLQSQLSLTSQQRDLWQRRAQPSLWDQVKQIPGKAITSTALMSVGYAACRIGGL